MRLLTRILCAIFLTVVVVDSVQDHYRILVTLPPYPSPSASCVVSLLPRQFYLDHEVERSCPMSFHELVRCHTTSLGAVVMLSLIDAISPQHAADRPSWKSETFISQNCRPPLLQLTPDTLILLQNLAGTPRRLQREGD